MGISLCNMMKRKLTELLNLKHGGEPQSTNLSLSPAKNGPFHLMSVPPLLRVNYKFYPLGKKDQSADAFPPSEKCRCFREIKGTDIATPSEMTLKTPTLSLGFP